MTTYNKATLKTFFQTSDIPDGNDYANFIDSYVNVVDTALQSMAGPLYTTELDTTMVSAAGINCTGTVSAVNFNITGSFVASAATFSGTVSASNLNATNSVTCSALRTTAVTIVSAAGTTQATAAILTATINRCQGVTNASTTGFAIPANQTGLVQYAVNETAVSANIWPPTGGVINGQAANTVWPFLANSAVTIFHYSASAYGIK